MTWKPPIGPINIPAWQRLPGSPDRKRLPPAKSLPSSVETRQALSLLQTQVDQRQRTADLLSRFILQSSKLSQQPRLLPLRLGIWKFVEMSHIPGVKEIAQGALMHSQPLLLSGVLIGLTSELSRQWNGKMGQKAFTRVLTPADVSKTLSEEENANPKAK